MTSPAPTKSQSKPLHNFELPLLKWKTEGSPSGHHQRRRTIKSPPPRPNPSLSPIRNSPPGDSDSVTPPPLLSELPVWSGKQPRGESSSFKPPTVHGVKCLSEPVAVPEFVKQSPINGDLVEELSESEEAFRRSLECPIIEYHRTCQKNAASNGLKISGFNSLNKLKEAAEPEGKKSSSKLLIKLPFKNKQQEDDNPKKKLVKIESGDEEPVGVEIKSKDVESKGKEKVKVESKNKDFESKCKEAVKIESKKQDIESKGKEKVRIESKNKDVESKGKEMVKIESKIRDVESKAKEPVKIENKGKEPVKIGIKGKEWVKFESKTKDVESKCKEPVKIESKKKDVESKDKEIVKIEGKDKDVEGIAKDMVKSEGKDKVIEGKAREMKIESKDKVVEGKGKERMKIEGKGKEPAKIEGKDKAVEGLGKELAKIESKNKNVEGKAKESVKSESKYKDVEAKGKDPVKEDGEVTTNDIFDEEIKSSWNLRPRKPLNKSKNTNKDGGGSALGAGGSSGSTSAKSEKGKTQSPKSNVKDMSVGNEKKVSGGGGEKKEKIKLSINIALTGCEIDEDMLALTGTKPSRRPKKRAKNVQNLLDSIFPGLGLVSITPESYYVSANSMKKRG